MTDIYGGSDPRAIPAYSVAETAYYLRVNQGTLRHWITGRSYSTSQGPKRTLPVIAAAKRRPYVLSFYNLIEVHVLRALRTSEEIPLQRIRKALKYVEGQMGIKHPLVNQGFETNGLDLFVEHYGKLINASQGGRVVVRNAVKDALHRIERDEEGVAAKFFLWARDPLEPRRVSVDPRISFGRAVLSGTGIPIASLAGETKQGSSQSTTA
jgi:hypothetical protein